MSKVLLFFLAFSISVLTSCDVSSLVFRRQFNGDMNYYMGLKNMESGKDKEAMLFFRKAQKSENKYVARRSSEVLVRLGNVQERSQACLYLVETYKDEDAISVAVEELVQEKEYAEIINLTDSIDMATAGNKLVKARLMAMQEKGDSRVSDTVYQWYIKRPISSEHFKYYLAHILNTEQNICDMNQQIIITFRMEIYRKSYVNAYAQMPSVISTIENDDRLQLNTSLISDMGKASLYGSNLWVKNARFFDSIAENAEMTGDDVNAYYAWFYAARLYEKDGSHVAATKECYANAMRSSTTDFDFDNSLWYLINMDMASSTSDAIETIRAYCNRWHDPVYFSDLFDTLSVLLLSNHRWDDFCEVYKIVDGAADNGTIAKYAYLSGRLIQLGLTEPSVSPEINARDMFKRAIDAGGDAYYKLMAVNQMHLSGNEMLDALYSTKTIADFVKDDDMEKLLCGYAEFGLSKYIFPEWQNFVRGGNLISLECSERLSKFVHDCADTSRERFARSIRIILRAINNCGVRTTDSALKLMYPRDFRDSVEKHCAEYNISEYLLYALIHSESLFNPDAESSAGAVGLTQLMKATAGDIANKLHVETYDLTDSDINIKFGAYYLGDLIKRLDGSLILAALAYNGGISRIRTWVRNFRLETDSRKVPKDIFLETIPYEETREYGKKITSNAIMYGYLYYNKTPSQITEEIFAPSGL